MAVTVQSVIDRVQTVLQDTTGVRWPVVAELVLWVNDAQREVALMKPDASAKNETVTLVAGTKQSIPTTGNRLLKVVRNMSAASNGTGKRSVRLGLSWRIRQCVPRDYLLIKPDYSCPKRQPVDPRYLCQRSDELRALHGLHEGRRVCR